MVAFAKRQAGLFDSEKFKYPVHIIGCGGIGSHLTVALARMGIDKISLYDFDTFQEHNLVNQHMFLENVGEHKARALRTMVNTINPNAVVKVRTIEVKKRISLSGVVIICIDSMSARRTIMESCLHNQPNVRCVIETRMDGRVGISHCFTPSNKRQRACWWEQWYSDEEATNMAGCSGAVSIISAIHGTSLLALKQLEAFARQGNTYGIYNRLYLDFEKMALKKTVWPTNPVWC